jgi:hypothetical protein
VNYSIAGTLDTSQNRVTIPLDYCPEHAAALGRLIGHWAFLETQLQGVIQCLMHSSQSKARFLWQEFLSAESRISLAQRINWHCVANAAIRDDLNRLLDEVRALETVRNTYVLGLWGESSGGTAALTLISNSLPGHFKDVDMRQELVTLGKLREDANSIAELSQRMSEWQSRYVEAYGSPL